MAMDDRYEQEAKESKRDKRVIQSYVLDKWFVSTIYRESSVAMFDPPWFYETMVWEWDAETRERGRLLYQAGDHDSHAEICRKLLYNEPLEPNCD